MPEPTETDAPEPERRTVSVQMTDVTSAHVDTRRFDDGTVALRVMNRRGTEVILRDSAEVLRAVLDEARVAVRLLNSCDNLVERGPGVWAPPEEDGR